MELKRLKNRFYQNEHVRFSRLESGYIFANLKANDYHYIDGAKAKIVDEIVRRVDSAPPGVVSLSWDEVSCGERAAADEMLAEKLLVVRHGQIRVSSRDLTWAWKNLDMPWPRHRKSRFRARLLMAFLFSYVVANFARWSGSPLVALKIIGFLKSRSPGKEFVSNEEIADICNNFCRMRSFFYTAKNRCYFDSMVATIFLSVLGFQPHWVFGVDLVPFKAHCWVKVGETVVTDELASVVEFVPIFSV